MVISSPVVGEDIDDVEGANCSNGDDVGRAVRLSLSRSQAAQKNKSDSATKRNNDFLIAPKK